MAETSYPPVVLLRGAVVLPADAAQQLLDLGQRMLDAADHWALLRDFPMAAQCHQAAAAYYGAAMIAARPGGGPSQEVQPHALQVESPVPSDARRRGRLDPGEEGRSE